MKLFKIENYQVVVEPEVFTLVEFKKLLDRDKTKNKEIVFKELAFIYHYADLKSDFNIILDKTEKIEAIKLRLGLKDSWQPDEHVNAAIDIYKERTITPQMQIYLNAMKAALDMGDYLSNSGALLRERTESGGVVTAPATIASALKTIPQVIKDLKAIESEVIREQTGLTERSIGAKTLNIYEDGFITTD